MASIIKMPSSGQNTAECLIVRWHVAEGDTVNRGDVLFEIETDKATMNVESFAKGTMLKVLYGEGEKVAAGEPVAYIGKPGERIGEAPAKPEAPAAKPAVAINMPPSGQNAAECLIVRWHVVEGDTVNRGDVLFEIETDKATMNVESFAKGTVLKVLYGEGEKVAAGEPVAYIGQPGDAVPGEKAAAAPLPEPEEEEEYEAIDRSVSREAHSEMQGESTPANMSKKLRVLASPKARAEARRTGKDLQGIFTRLGRPVRYQDVAQAAGAAPCISQSAVAEDAPYTVEVPSTMRRTIARRMLESAAQAPQFTISMDMDMSKLVALRAEVNGLLAEQGCKVSFNDFIAKAASLAAMEIPYIRAVYTDEEIRISNSVHVGIAVALPAGLVVPVVRDCSRASVREIAIRSRAVIEAARSGKLRPEDMQGGTLTISNLGMYGVGQFTALVNRPESAILAVGAMQDTPVVVDGRIEICPRMNITASFDHRIIDGGVGAQFMARLRKYLEAPLELLL